MANELTVTKEEIARYVHDAVEMEAAIYTLDQEINQLQREVQVKHNNNICNLREINDKISKHERTLENNPALPLAEDCITRPKQTPFEPTFKNLFGNYVSSFVKGIIGSIVGGIFAAPLLLAAIIAILGFIVLPLLDINAMSIVGTPSFLIPCGIICGCITVLGAIGIYIYCSYSEAKANHKTNFEEEMRKYDSSIIRHNHQYKVRNELRKETQAQLNQAQSKRQEELKRQEVSKREIEIAEQQIEYLMQQRNALMENRSQFYSIGIIPPDYRKVDCAIYLDHYYRNDLADSMKEAILLYREDYKFGKIIEGMNNMIALLSSIESSMSTVAQTVKSIDSNIKIMSQDFYTFSERMTAGQANQHKAMEELIGETRMSRYATEQVAESAKCLEWHENRRYYLS